MSAEDELKDAYRRIIDAISAGDAEGLNRLVAPDVVDHNPLPNQAPGRDGFKQWMSAARTAFPDMHGTVEDVMAEGDRVAARMTWHGTHRGEFMGVGPTDKRVSFSAFHLVRFSQDRAVEWWAQRTYWERFGNSAQQSPVRKYRRRRSTRSPRNHAKPAIHRT